MTARGRTHEYQAHHPERRIGRADQADQADREDGHADAAVLRPSACPPVVIEATHDLRLNLAELSGSVAGGTWAVAHELQDQTSPSDSGDARTGSVSGSKSTPSTAHKLPAHEEEDRTGQGVERDEHRERHEAICTHQSGDGRRCCARRSGKMSRQLSHLEHQCVHGPLWRSVPHRVGRSRLRVEASAVECRAGRVARRVRSLHAILRIVGWLLDRRAALDS